MLSKCANPGCPAIFLYLHEGKLFRLDTSSEIIVGTPASETKKAARHIEFFWLCDQCAAELTLGYSKGYGIRVVALPNGMAEAASVS
ncbi:MAG: hypothetical protein ACRD23_13700 [Terriglobales bacterium]